MLVDVAEISLETTLLGTPVSMPLGIAPFAMQRLLDPEGEAATARAAATRRRADVVSTLTTRTHAEIAAASAGPGWLQLYVLRDRQRTLDHIAEAREAGYSALVLTVDLPYVGRRERDLRLGFQNPPPDLDAARTRISSRRLRRSRGAISSGSAPSASCRSSLKGILTREDAVLAVEHGADAVWVSNHGGRQLDGVAAGLDALPEVVEAVGRAVRGVRRRRHPPRHRRREGARARRARGVRGARVRLRRSRSAARQASRTCSRCCATSSSSASACSAARRRTGRAQPRRADRPL